MSFNSLDYKVRTHVRLVEVVKMFSFYMTPLKIIQENNDSA